MSKVVALDPAAVERFILDWARFGGFGTSGVNRPVYTDAWVGAQAQYEAWCREAGLATRMDAVGSVWGVLEGREGGPSIVSGSHCDSQVQGGRYDGALGALAALIALKELSARYGPPRRTLECVSLCEEEGSRVIGAQFWGSRAVTGRIGPDDPTRVTGWDGETIADAMRAVGLDPARVAEARRDDIAAFVELHIEQGPILEQVDKPVAIVSAITGMRQYLVELTGEQNHAGALPMDLRRDAMAGFAEIVSGALNTAHRWGRPAVTTVGRCIVEPNFQAVIPEKITFSLDARHPDPELCERLYATHERMMAEIAARHGLGLTVRVLNDHRPAVSDAGLVATFTAAAEAQGVPFHVMHSGAGHDSQQMARIAPVAMIFVRSKDGRSHTPEEFSSVEDIVAGFETLAGGLYQLAY